MTTSELGRFRPMLAASLPTGSDEDLGRLNYSWGFLCSPKMDGIRAIAHPDMGLISRTLKPIRNRYIQESVMNLGHWVRFTDGELVLKEASDVVEFNDNQSAIMSGSGEPIFTFNVFDHVEYPGATYEDRLRYLNETVQIAEAQTDVVAHPIRIVKQKLCKTAEEILEYEQEQLSKGFEGIIIRHPLARYKNNRSTFREQGMIKLKRFEDAEAVIEDFVELERNTNEAFTDALGYTKRTQHKDGQVLAGTLGKIQVRGINGRFKDTPFFIGSGFDMPTRDRIWNNRDGYRGQFVRYKFQDHGSKDAPRSPIFLGFRDPEDM